MSSMYFLIPLSIVLLIVAIGLFVWAARRGQFDDLETPAWRVLLDDEHKPPAPRDTDESDGR
jgi:cbb3-type cytochrome oxidase maturation protein